MSKRKLIKKIFMEAFQWTAFSLPIFVTGQRFASKECPEVCPGEDNTEYWVLIAGIIAYVAGITLVVWLPVKVFIVWKKVIRPYEGLWLPGNLLYVLFSATPCVAFILMGHEHCIANEGQCFDYFRGAPIETFVIMLVVTDWSEKIRFIKLRSVNDSMRENKYTSASLERGMSVRTYDPNYDGMDALGTSRRSSVSQKSLLHPSVRNGTWRQRLARSMKWTDARPENLLRDVMLAYDIRVLLDLSLISFDDGTTVFETPWVYPIYILSVISFFPLVFAPNSEMRSCVTVLLQDIPFFIFRIAIFSHFGSDLVLNTSVLFLIKNFFVAFAFFYFNAFVPWHNSRKETHEYELRRLSKKPRGDYTRPNGDAFGPRADASAYPTEIGERNPYVSTFAGVSNPAYQSRRYDSPRPLRREYAAEDYQDAEWDEHYNQEPRITSIDAGAMYASHHVATNPQPRLGRVESVVNRVPDTYTEEPATFLQHQYLGDANRVVQDHAAPANPPSPEKKFINFDSLNDPNSFLYSQDRTKKPRVYDIEFERHSQMPQPPIAQSSSQERNTPEKKSTSGSVLTSAPSTEELALGNEDNSGEATSSNPQQQDQTNYAIEPPYSQIDYTKKTSRRKAPPPPTKPSLTAKSSTRPNDSTDTLPPPPPEILNHRQPPLQNGDTSRSSSSKYHPAKRTDSYCTPTLARQIASEVVKRNEDKAAMDAVKALQEAAEYGTNIGNDWSASTAPKSTLNVKPPFNISPVSDEDYDDSL